MQEKEIREGKEKVQQAYYKLRKWPYEVLGLNQFKKKTVKNPHLHVEFQKSESETRSRVLHSSHS